MILNLNRYSIETQKFTRFDILFFFAVFVIPAYGSCFVCSVSFFYSLLFSP
jgi:hypothetical protein